MSLVNRSDYFGFAAFGQHFKDRQLLNPISGMYELYHMVIDAGEQGLGLGRASTIHILKDMAQQPDCKQLVVACHPDNKSATTFYKSLGFLETGKNYDDDPLYSMDAQKIKDMESPIPHTRMKAGSRVGAEQWRTESIQSHSAFDWAAWGKGLEA